MIGLMPFDPSTLMHDGTWLSVFGVLAAFVAFYIARSTIQFIYSVWPFGKIKALRDATKIVDKWPVASPSSHLHARAQVVRRLNEATGALAKQIIQAKLSGVAATIANFAQGIIGVIMLMSYVRSKVSPDTVGIWSIVVLGASLFKRVFNLDTAAEKAKKDTDKLEALIRYGQDKLAALDARSMQGQDRTDALLILIDEITAQLTQIINPGAEVPKPPGAPTRLRWLIRQQRSSRDAVLRQHVPMQGTEVRIVDVGRQHAFARAVGTLAPRRTRPPVEMPSHVARAAQKEIAGLVDRGTVLSPESGFAVFARPLVARQIPSLSKGTPLPIGPIRKRTF